MKEIDRREFGLICTTAASSAMGRATNASQVSREPLLKSNHYLTVGLDLDRQTGFVEERATGELWEWDLPGLRGASEETVSSAWGDLNAVSDGLRPLSVNSVERLENGFQLKFIEEWGEFLCSVRLEPNRPEVVFSVEPDLRKPFKMGAVRFPGSLSPAGKGQATLVDTVAGGRLHRKPSSPLTMIAALSWMRFHAALGEKSSYLSILEPGFDAALTLGMDENKKWGFSWFQLPRLGHIDRTRSQRFIFQPRSSYVSVARAYREYSRRIGLYRSLIDKLEECPSLKGLFGAVLLQLGYLHDFDADYASSFRKLKKMGVERAYVYPTGYYNLNGGNELYPGFPWIDLDAKTVGVMNELGYLHAPWIWLNEILDSSPYFNDEMTLKTADGKKIPNWKIGELQWYWSHEGRMLELLRQEAPKLRDRFTAAHFDVLNAGRARENFGSWPYDRAQDAEYRNEMFRLFSGHDRVVGCEQNKDWAVPYKHFGTNKRPGPYGNDAKFWPVPLWQLVFHDSVMTTWWEHSTYNDPALGHDFTGKEIRPRMLLDILTADLPSVCPVGKMYGWKKPGDPDREIFVFRYSIDDQVTQDAIKAAVQVSQFNMRHATDDLVHHEFLSEDGREQQTVFSSGTRVKIRLPEEGNSSDQGELEIA
jgi:hypothetical protein